MPWRLSHRSRCSSLLPPRPSPDLSDSLTYDEVPCIAEERSDSRPYLGHVPYFAPKLASNPEHREQ